VIANLILPIEWTGQAGVPPANNRLVFFHCMLLPGGDENPEIHAVQVRLTDGIQSEWFEGL